MTDRKFTFLELHLHESDLQFGPKGLDSLLGAGETTDSSERTDDGETAESSGGRSKLLTLLLLAGLAFALRKLLGGDEGAPGLDDVTDLDNVTDLGVITGDEGAEEETTVTDEENVDVAGEDDAVSIDIEDAEADDGGSRLRPLVGLALVVAIAVAARKLLGGSEDLDDLEALDDVAPEQ